MKVDTFIPPSKGEVTRRFLRGQAGPTVEEARQALLSEKAANKSAEETARANRKRLDEMSVDEVNAARIETVLAWMATEPFIQANRNFFTWGPSEHNWKQLLQYFDVMGWKLVDVDQVGRAFRYLLDSGCFQTKEVLQRSESYMRPREFSPDMLRLNNVVTPAQIKEAKRKLRCFSGRRITSEMALSRVSQAEWDAIVREMDSAKSRTTEDLTAEILSSRKVRSRAEVDAEQKVV